MQQPKVNYSSYNIWSQKPFGIVIKPFSYRFTVVQKLQKVFKLPKSEKSLQNCLIFDPIWGSDISILDHFWPLKLSKYWINTVWGSKISIFEKFGTWKFAKSTISIFDFAQCGNLGIFLPLRFCAKSIV